MSYLVTENMGGNLHSAAASINRMGIARHLMQLESVHVNTIAIFRVDSWDDYLLLCKALHRVPVDISEFFA